MADGPAYVTAGTSATGSGRGVCGVGRCNPEAERSDSVLRLGQCDGSDRGIPVSEDLLLCSGVLWMDYWHGLCWGVAAVATSPVVLVGDVAVGVMLRTIAGVASPADFAAVVAADVISLADAGMVTAGVTDLADAGAAPLADAGMAYIYQSKITLNTGICF